MLRWSIACALVAGAVLRASGVRDQVLSGDEFHALNAALEWPVSQILRTWTYKGADYGVPLGALFRLLFDAGITLGELELRAPALAAGTLSIAVMPWMLRDRLGPRATGVFAWLLAISPLLVLYSRMVRSYAPAVLLAFLAVASFERWWASGRRRAGAGYVVSATSALWLNLSVAPFVAAPVVIAAARIAFGDAAARARLRSGLVLAACAAVAAALPLLPAWASFGTLGEVHGDGGLPSLETWSEIVRMHSGSTHWIATAAVLAALARGTAIAWARQREWLVYVAALPVLHVIGLAAIGPDQLDSPIVINRYLLVALPFGLALTAIGLAEPVRRLDARVQATAIAVGLAALFATGPLVERTLRESNFSTASTYAYFVREGNAIERDDMPAFYRDLAAAEGVEPVLEYPFANVASHAFDAYQKHHRQPVYVVAPWKNLRDDRLALERTLPASAELYLDSPARWLVVHLDLQREERRVRTSDRNHWFRLTERPDLWVPLQEAGPTTTRLLERRFGPADRASELLRVWDLERLRRER